MKKLNLIKCIFLAFFVFISISLCTESMASGLKFHLLAPKGLIVVKPKVDLTTVSIGALIGGKFDPYPTNTTDKTETIDTNLISGGPPLSQLILISGRYDVIKKKKVYALNEITIEQIDKKCIIDTTAGGTLMGQLVYRITTRFGYSADAALRPKIGTNRQVIDICAMTPTVLTFKVGKPMSDGVFLPVKIYTQLPSGQINPAFEEVGFLL